MPPPPWELSVTLKPSMLDGLQVKLLGYGLVSLVLRDRAVRVVGYRMAERVGVADRECERIGAHAGQQRGAGREGSRLRAVTPRGQSVELQPFGQDRNARAFIGAHQRGLL